MPSTSESSITLATDEKHVMDTLKRCSAEAGVMRERLAALLAMKAEFDDAVFERVHADYSARLQQVEDKAAPLLAQARAVHARVRHALAELSSSRDSSRLDQQEIELRHRLGEFDDAEHARRIEEIQTTLTARADAHASAASLHEQLEQVLAGWSDAQVAEPAAMPPVQTAEPDHPASAAEPAVAHTRILSVPSMPPPPPVPASAAGTLASESDPSATMSLRVARLVPQNPQAGRSAVPLPPRPVTLGADEGSDIRVRGEDVERVHARITVSAAGYTLTDLGSKVGTTVNAHAVSQQLLRHEDVIQIGPARYVFREG